jgi:hypothetical protein
VKESTRVGHYLRAHLGDSQPGRCCVALLASSSVVFVLLWLGLIRVNYEVLLIAYVRTQTTLLNYFFD